MKKSLYRALSRHFCTGFLSFFLWLPSFVSYGLTGEINACFTPGQNCTQAIVDAIEQAHKTLLFQAYQFTSAPIARAVVEAKRRGVDAKIILDKSQYSPKRYSSAVFFNHAGLPVWIDRKVSIAHNKVMIIDDYLVITGSFNFTKAAQQRNAENVLLIQSPELAKAYTQNWMKRQGASVPLKTYIDLKRVSQ